MGDVAIRAENISKRYRIAIGAVSPRHPARPADGRRGASAASARGEAARPGQEVFWALRDVSFEIKQGEVVGIVGRNGAGKSTLLKILSRITEPSAGRAEIYGRVGSLLEVGTGFHPELTGRENIYLNGAILGMRKAEIDRKLDEIVAFSEVEQFIDTPVKRYSSGMYVRLAFAVAAHLEPEILIVDEVLAVGDAAFQRKCLGKMGDVAREGRTVLFVSHNMAAITRLCRLGDLARQAASVRDDGPTDEVVAKYFAAGVQALGELSYPGPSRRSAGLGVHPPPRPPYPLRAGRGHDSLDARSALSVEVEYEVLRPAVGYGWDFASPLTTAPCCSRRPTRTRAE